MATTQSDDSDDAPEGKIITCAVCGNIHPNDTPCKPWGDEVTGE